MQYLMLIIQLICFLFIVFLCFIIPGVFLLKRSKINLSFWENVILGTVVGLIFFSLLSYLLLIVNLHLLLLPIIFAIDFFAAKTLLSLKNKFSLPSGERLTILTIVFTLGIIGQLLVIAPSGFVINGNLLFWSSHGHDGLWHIALMEEYKKGFPLQNPVFAGERLVNYHFFSDIALADFNRYFKLPTMDLYFRFFPLLFSFLLGALAYLLGRKLGGSFQAGIWAVIFTYFAGSFGYIVTFLKDYTIRGESIFWASQIQSSSGNPPQIAAFIIVLAFLYIFNIFIKEKGKIIFFICTLLVGSLAVFKIYAAVVILTSLGFVGLWQLIRERKFNSLLLFLTSSLLSVVLYLPNSANATSFLIFEPWWFIRTMIVAPDRLNWIDLELKRQTYIYEGNWKRVVQIEVTGFLIFFFGNLGMRFLGIFSFIKILKTIFSNYLHMMVVLIIIISLVLPLIFLQKGVATNSIQFLQYFLLLFGILASVTVTEIFKKIKIKFLNLLLILLLILLSVPTQLSLINSFYNRSAFAKIEKQELDALRFLKENISQNSIVLTPNYNKDLNMNDPVPHIWDWFDTAYVAALSGKRTYLSDTEQVDIMGYDFKRRLEFKKTLFMENDPDIFIQELKTNKIDYIYFPIALSPKLDLSNIKLKKVFTNSQVEIWKVN